MIVKRLLQRLQRHHCRCLSSKQIFSANSLLMIDQVDSTTIRPTEIIDASKIQIVGNKGSRKPVATVAATSNPKKMLDRYADFQQQFPGHLVLMQVGDFFEVYGQDALKVSRLLDIGLTSVNKAVPTPMTGVPVRSVEGHLERLIRAGESVVLCEQFSTGGLRMDRRVTRIITPGTLTEEGLLQSGQNNFLLAIKACDGDASFGLAWIDISTGYFRMASVVGEEELVDRLIKLNPKEILVQQENIEALLKMHLKSTAIHSVDVGALPIQRIGQVYHQIFSGSGDEAFDQSRLLPFSQAQLGASCILLEYVLRTQLDRRPYIEFPSVEDDSRVMHIDRTSFRSLEILQSNANPNNNKASLLGTIDNTKTAESPSLEIDVINNRLDFVEELLVSFSLQEELGDLLRGCKDLERCYQRLALNRSSGGPRDMQLILQTLGEIDRIRQVLDRHSKSSSCCELFMQVLKDLSDFSDLIRLLSTALNERLPYRVSDGLVIKTGYSQRLDDLRNGTGDVRKARSLLENRYRNETGKSSLRIDEGKMLGFFVEVSRAEGPISPELVEFHLDGQTESKYRYRTSALNALKDSHAVNEAKILEEESIIYEELRQMIIRRGPEIILAAKAIAELDVAASMAITAKSLNFTRPILVDDGHRHFAIKDGRHPVVESIQTSQGRPFIGNDCELGEKPFALITGPNMGGKSTFLRQNALIAILAQCGSFVPAASCELGIVDAIYTRIGASDDLAQDRSTFMMEMMETAGILKGASPKSLVIMDEIGRGTATEEGFALAWAIAEHLIKDIGCRVLFATHYYDLAELTKEYPEQTLALQTTALTDDNAGVTFLHKLIPGVASYAYAIQIGRFAGLPEVVLQAAQRKLDRSKLTRQIPEVGQLDMDGISPRDAHSILSNLVNSYK